jgi:16S rRNA (guanine527-N7)-methyltransferase
LTAIRDFGEARRVLLDDSLRGAELVASFDGPIIDVGTGGGAPGIPLAYVLPEREVVLLEAERRKCTFLEEWAPRNARVVWGRAEEQETDWAGLAVAKALAQPPTAAEWCPSAERERVAAVAEQLAGELEDAPEGFIVIRKLGPTPEGFPRRAGVAKKRPLA